MVKDVGVLIFDLTFVSGLIFIWINVGVAAFILYLILYNPVRKFMQDRQDRISAQIRDAATQLKEAETLKKEYQDKLRDIEAEKVQILDASRRRIAEREELIISEARGEAKAIKDRAMLDIAREKDKASDEMKRQIIEISSLLAGRFVKKGIDEDTKAILINESLADLGDVKWPS